MIKLNNRIFAAKFFFESFNKLNTCENLPIKYLYTLVKLNKIIEEKRIIFEESKQKLFENYGTKDKSGNVVVDDDKMEDVNKEFNELANIEFEVNIEPLVYLESMNLTVQDLVILESIINIED